MPFETRWSEEAKRSLHHLAPMDIMAVRKVIGSFQHDRWLEGSPVSALGIHAANLMELSNGPIRVFYELDQTTETVHIRAIIRD